MAEPGEYLRETAGLTMREVLERRTKKLQNEGRYHDELTLKERDPVKYEVLYAKLMQSVYNGKEVCKRISGSIINAELGENIIEVFTAEGDAVALSPGVLLHIHTISRNIKFILENDYEDNPGIREGDHFFNNDPHIGGQHSPDQNIVTPIFHEGRLVAWAGGMTHVAETGATSPGGTVPDATSRFYEGLMLTAIKIAENDTCRRDLEILVERATRDATAWLLDVRGKMGAICNVRRDVKALIEEYGVDYFTEAMHEYVEDSRRAAKVKIRQITVPGTYRARAYTDVVIPGKLQTLLQFEVKMIFDKEGNMTLDLHGSSPAGLHPFGGSLASTEGATLCGMLQAAFYDTRYNDGTLYAMTLNIPENSVFWVHRTAATSRFISGVGSPLMSSLFEIISRGNYLTGHLDDVVSPNPATHPVTNFGGIDQWGRPYSIPVPEHGVEGTSALAYQDGVHTSYAMWCPPADMGDIEIWERNVPFLVLGRHQRRDGGGVGKFRGGSGLDSLWMIYNSGGSETSWLGSSKFMAIGQGLNGGYPSPSAVMTTANNTDMKEILAEQRPYPTEFGTVDDREIPRYVKGDIDLDAPIHQPPRPVENYALMEPMYQGGAGYGDPLERDPALVIKDLADRTMSMRRAREVYCVVLEGDESRPERLRCDEEKTGALREAKRRERRELGRPAAEYLAQWREKLVKGEIPKHPKAMINQVLRFSPGWADWFRREWNLPESFKEVP